MFRSLVTTASAISAVVALPQGINFAAVEGAPTPSAIRPPISVANQAPTYNPSAAAQSAAAAVATDPVLPHSKRSLARRSACALQPDGHGPRTTPDTYDAFMNDPQYGAIAENAWTPQGYSQTFSNLQGATEGNGYMGLYTLQEYDTIKCQQLCDTAPSCIGFNVYIERDPKLEPADDCPNPESVSNYKCTLWGLPVTSEGATNKGQWRSQFQVGIQASNGYTKNAPPAAQDGFDGPAQFGGAIEASYSYIGMRFYPGAYDPGVCAAICRETTNYDREHLVRADDTYDACNFFNSYVLSKNNVPEGTYCGLYTKLWDKLYSTNVGQWRGSDYYSVSDSYGYSLNPQDSGQL